MTTDPFPIDYVRGQFPALEGPLLYFDGPAGSQVPRSVADAVTRYLLHQNANRGGRFPIAVDSDAALDEAWQAVADFVGTADASEIVFGPNMTSLAFHLARALARTWKPTDTIVVCDLEHDANVTPWRLAAESAGSRVRRVALRAADGTLDLASLDAALADRPRFLAVAAVSNALGTINPVAEIVRRARAAGALAFVDAVHHAPHLRLDVTEWGADFVACSAYKFFGPHVGILWGRADLLAELETDKLRPAPSQAPERWMTGTANHEGILGTAAAVEYLAGLGRHLAGDALARPAALDAAFEAITTYERELSRHLLAGLAEISDVRVWGITEPQRLGERVPTVSFTHARRSPTEIVDHLARHGIQAWHGNFYALPVTEALGLEPAGMVRVGCLHYDTPAEIDQLLRALRNLPG